jgi:hypothetical protein
MEDRDLRYPLHWPHGRERTPPNRRSKAPFHATRTTGGGWKARSDLSFSAARDRLMAELDRVGARSAVLSTNLELRLDGLPRGGTAPEDPGVIVEDRHRALVVAAHPDRGGSHERMALLNAARDAARRELRA